MQDLLDLSSLIFQMELQKGFLGMGLGCGFFFGAENRHLICKRQGGLGGEREKREYIL